MTHPYPDPLLSDADGPPVARLNPDGKTPLLLVCEHASPVLPAALGDLGLAAADRLSHAAWDPGAFDLAQALSARLDAPLIAARFSRLAYDCNRPPGVDSAMPATSERVTVPGNAALGHAARAARTDALYHPFHAALSQQIEEMGQPALITVHSFTPVYFGQTRDVELGLLFDPRDDRLGRAMLSAPRGGFDVRANAPYGPADGVLHTLERHALPQGLLNTMIEVRNDLLTTPDAVATMADALIAMLRHGLARFSHLSQARA